MDNFTLIARKKNNDLHIQFTGIFDEDSACALKSICNTQYNPDGRLFLDLRKLESFDPPQQIQFKRLLGELTLPPQKMFLKGEQALNVGLNGTRVLLSKSKKCACKIPCKICSCKNRRQDKYNNLQQYSV